VLPRSAAGSFGTSRFSTISATASVIEDVSYDGSISSAVRTVSCWKKAAEEAATFADSEELCSARQRRRREATSRLDDDMCAQRNGDDNKDEDVAVGRSGVSVCFQKYCCCAFLMCLRTTCSDFANVFRCEIGVLCNKGAPHGNSFCFGFLFLFCFVLDLVCVESFKSKSPFAASAWCARCRKVLFRDNDNLSSCVAPTTRSVSIFFFFLVFVAKR
jgi:hypothetical protein